MTWLLTIEARDADNQPVTLRFADGAYDSPDDTLYEPRIQQPGLYTAGMYAGDLVSVQRSGVGETTLINHDGGLDYLADYAVDGRQMVLSRVVDGQEVEILRGTVDGLSWGRRDVSVRLREPQALLRRNHPHQVYAGDNIAPDGLEGTEDDIKGRWKPRLWGDVRNAEPVMVNASKLIYQVSDLADCDIAAAYDRGAGLTDGGAYASLQDLEDTAPAAGEFRAYQGYLRLGASPQGTVTVDAGTAQAGAGDVMAMIADEAGYPLDAGDLADLNALGAVALYNTDAVDTTQLLDQLADGLGAYWRINDAGVLRAQPLAAPGTPALTLEDYQIHEIQRRATGAGDNGLPIWRVTVRADPLETTQTDLAGSVGDARRARLANAYREAVAERADVLERHPLAEEVMIESRLRSLADAQATAERIADLVSVRRDRVTLEAQLLDSQNAAIVTTVRVATPRRGYDEGRDMLVIGRQIDARSGRHTLELWG